MKRLIWDDKKSRTIRYIRIKEYDNDSFCSENNIEEAIDCIKRNVFNITRLNPPNKSYLLCDSLFVRLQYEEITIRK